MTTDGCGIGFVKRSLNLTTYVSLHSGLEMFLVISSFSFANMIGPPTMSTFGLFLKIFMAVDKWSGYARLSSSM